MMRRALATCLLPIFLAAGCQYIGPTGATRTSFHGDSMGAQADRQVTDRLTRTYRLFRYSQERATISTMVPVIRRLMVEGPRPEIVIIELGAGDAYERRTDAQLRTSIRTVLDLVRRVPCIRWLNLKIEGVNGFYQGYLDRADDFNRILRNEVDRYARARVAPYRQWALTHANSFKADGLHHTERGKVRFAQFIDSVAGGCA